MINLKDYGYFTVDTVQAGLIPARITEIHRGLYKAVCENGEISVKLKGSYFRETTDSNIFPAVGDFVLLKYNNSGFSSIVKILPRKSKFSRTDFSGHAVGYVKSIREQVVAANFDYIFIMSSLNQDFNINRIARYLTMAKQSGAIPIIILTKADLCENWDKQTEAIRELAGDVDAIVLSSHSGMGLVKLNKFLIPAKTIVFLGMSGVGKSSLLNVLAGEELMNVKDIRETDARGRHTTTHRQLIKLPSGVLIIDTPGMRELGLWDADNGINSMFWEIEELFTKCRYSNCKHTTEPNCAVKAAIENGSLPQKQWELYLAQKREAEFVKRKSIQYKKRG